MGRKGPAKAADRGVGEAGGKLETTRGEASSAARDGSVPALEGGCEGADCGQRRVAVRRKGSACPIDDTEEGEVRKWPAVTWPKTVVSVIRVWQLV